ncbi:MAG: PIN domain-containing protein [Merismopedia sp. SIO2A8]|nr:PIN domain-containing protein [Merismopedia sp. SIO2A8]
MIIADTGFFVALGNRRDRYHIQASQIIQQISEPLITTQPVITETCYVLTRNAGID